MHNLTSGYAILWCPCCISSPQQMLHNIFHHKSHVTAYFFHNNYIIVTFMLQYIQGNFRCKNAKNVIRNGNSNKIKSKQYPFRTSLRKNNKWFWQCISIFNQNGNYAFVFIDEIIICMRLFRFHIQSHIYLHKDAITLPPTHQVLPTLFFKKNCRIWIEKL